MRLNFTHWLINWVTKRKPDVVIGGENTPYLYRWHIIPRNRVFNAYLHLFLRSDDDRALHDHPWANLSVLLRGKYVEHTIDAGGIERRTVFGSGDWRLRLTGKLAHRIELFDGPCWTLFVSGPRYRQWGFHCPKQGWIHWRRFTASEDSGAVGPGCEG